MTLAFVVGNKISEYPVSFSDLRRKYPHVSFPSRLSDIDLEAFGAVEVVETPPPSFDFKIERLTEVNPSYDISSNTWKQSWSVVSLTPQEIQEIEDNKSFDVRLERNAKLAACDWTQLADSPLDADAKLVWALYRETLRMVPQQAGFPWEVQWPPEPGS